jgi:metal-sulfur cluster biosynthetic enzyme
MSERSTSAVTSGPEATNVLARQAKPVGRKLRSTDGVGARRGGEASLEAAARSERDSGVLAALETVRDPELDEPITTLGFVASCTVSAAGDAQVRLRLPTYFCAPNFAFLMVADAYDAVSAVRGVRRTEIVLDEHSASDAINTGVAAQAGFVRTFTGEAAAELGGLRADFLRKAVLAGTDRVCRPLLAAGTTLADLAAMTLGELPPSQELDRLRRRRAELGLPAGDGDPLLVDPTTGAAVRTDALPLHLRRARATRVGIEANGGICRGMLRVRYDTSGEGQEEEK